MFHRFYKLDYLVTTNGTLNDIVSYIFDLIFSSCFLFQLFQLFYLSFVKTPIYALPPVSAIDLQT